MDRKLLWVLLYLFCFTIPLSQFLSIRLLILVLCFSLFIKTNNAPRFFILNSWDLISYLAVLIAGLIYTEDLQNGLGVLETSFCFLALPLIFYKIQAEESDKIVILLKVFCLGVLVASVICIINACYSYQFDHNFKTFQFYQLTSIIDFQPTYFAYYLIFTITFILHLLYDKINKKRLLVGILFISFCFIMLLLTGGQTAFIALLLSFSFFVMKYTLEERTFTKSLIMVLLFLMLFMMFYISNSENFKDFASRDSWDRYDLWKAGLLANTDYVYGVGTGDYKLVLNKYFLSTKLNEYALQELNSHNQFIHTLLSNGIFGLMALLAIIIRPIYLSYKVKNVYGILFLFPFIIYGITEVFLGRYQGVIFFVMIHQSFVLQYYSSNLSTIITKS